MAKKVYIGYNQISGNIYINEKGEPYMNKDVKVSTVAKAGDVRSIDPCLEKVIRVYGQQLGKRKVDLTIDTYYRDIGSRIEGYLRRYVKKINSKNYISDKVFEK